MTETRRLDIIIGARDRAKGVIAKVRANFTRFMKVGAVAAGAATAALTAMVNAQRQAIGETARLARQTGVGVEALSAMQFAARKTKTDLDDFKGAIEELNIRLGEAIIDGTGPAGAALRKLGLDARRLSEVPLDERFGSIADALNDMGNASERQFLADEIFGGDAFKIMPLLNQGSRGIRELTDEAERFGFALSELDAAKVQASNEAIADVRRTAVGLGQQLTIHLAPVIEHVADRFSAWATSGTGASEKVAKGVAIVAKVINFAAKALTGFRVVFNSIKVVALTVGQAVAGMASLVSEVVTRLINAIPGVDIGEGIGSTLGEFTKILDEERKKAADGLRDAINTGLEGSDAIDVEKLFADVTKKSEQAIREKADAESEHTRAVRATSELVFEQLDAARQRLETLGLTSDELAVHKARQAGATEAQIDQLEALQESVRERRSEVDLVAEGVRLAERRESAEAKAADQVRALNAALEAGRINQTEYERAVARVTEEYAEQNRQARDIGRLTRAAGASVRFLVGVAGGGGESSRRAEALRYQRAQASDVSRIRSMLEDLVRRAGDGGQGQGSVTIGGLIG